MKARPTGAYRLKSQSRNALLMLHDQGLDLPDKPEGQIPDMPPDLSDLGDEDLMAFWGSLTAWMEYLSAQVACAQIDERDAQKRIDTAEAVAMVDGWSGKPTDRIAIARARFATDPAAAEMSEEVETRHAYRKLVEVLATNCERNNALVSRELTRRTSDGSRFRRTWSTP